MEYKVLCHRNIKKDLKKLDKQTVYLFFNTVREIIIRDPYSGIKLKGRYKDLWKHRIGDYWIIYSIMKEKVKIYVLRISHRRNVYDNIF